MFIIHKIDNKLANESIKKWHRHNQPVNECFITFCYGVFEYIFTPIKSKKLLGVCIVGEPSGRTKCKNTFEIRRVCFRPEVKFSKLKRWYEYEDKKFKKQPKLSMRIKPLLLQDFGGFTGTAIKTHELPSYFLQVAELYILNWVKLNFKDHRIKECKRLWTYIHFSENGSYLAKAEYKADKIFQHSQGDGITRIRYSKLIKENINHNNLNLFKGATK